MSLSNLKFKAYRFKINCYDTNTSAEDFKYKNFTQTTGTYYLWFQGIMYQMNDKCLLVDTQLYDYNGKKDLYTSDNVYLGYTMITFERIGIINSITNGTANKDKFRFHLYDINDTEYKKEIGVYDANVIECYRGGAIETYDYIQQHKSKHSIDFLDTDNNSKGTWRYAYLIGCV